MAAKKKNTVRIGGKDYPCRFSMGAFRRFERESGKSYRNIDPESAEDVTTLLWAAVKSACNADGVSFDLSADDLADLLTPEEVSAWAESVQEAAGDVSPKKKAAM